MEEEKKKPVLEGWRKIVVLAPVIVALLLLTWRVIESVEAEFIRENITPLLDCVKWVVIALVTGNVLGDHKIIELKNK